jgi:hypothetical protein
MAQTIHINTPDVPPHIRRAVEYSGRKWKIQVAEQVHIPSQNWSGGSVQRFYAVNLETGKSGPVEDPRPWPESMAAIGQYQIPPGLALLCHSIFSGKDMGVTIYLHPTNASALLPKPTGDSLNPIEKIVLCASAALKSSYMGQDRYQMVCEGAYKGVPNRPKELNALAEAGITRLEWDDAKANLIARGFLSKRGAITTKGRNAEENIR